MRTFEFVEPHYTGGESVITITEDKLIEFMHTKDYLNGVSDEELIRQFCIEHWAIEIKEGDSDEN